MIRVVARSLQQAARLRVLGAATAPNATFLIPVASAMDIPRTFAVYPQHRAPTKELSTAELRQLAQSSRAELTRSQGMAGYFSRGKQVRHTWNEFVAKTPTPSAGDLLMFFAAAKATEADNVLIETLIALRQLYPKEVKVKHYIESKVAFLRSKRYADMLDIFEAERAAQSHPQAIFYVWALSALNDLGDFDRALELLQEMRNAGYMIPNETVSRIMYNLACLDDKEGVLALYREVDASMGIWTPAALNRLMTALGRVGCPEEAFQIYSLSTIDLDPSTFKTLMEICVRNECHKEAADVLKNRSLFNIKLDSGGYNTILEALMMLDRKDEMGAVLQEMRDNGVNPDSKTKFLLRRHDYAGEASLFESTLPKDPTSEKLDALLTAKDFAEASKLASSILVETATPLTQSMLNAIAQAFLLAGDDVKIDALLKQLNAVVWSSTGPALQTIMRHYAMRRKDASGNVMIVHPERAMAAYKAARVQNVPVLNPRGMFPVFLYLGEHVAALEELHRYVAYHKNPARRSQMHDSVIFDALRVLVKCQQYDAFERTVRALVDANVTISPKAFCSFWFDPTKFSFFGPTLNDKQKHKRLLHLGSVLAGALRLLMEKQDFVPTYEALDAVSNTLYYSGQRGTLVQLYLRVTKRPSDVLPEQTYGKLLDALVFGRRDQEAMALYKEAMARLPAVQQPWLLAAPIAESLASTKQLGPLADFVQQHPYPSVFRAALLKHFDNRELRPALNVLTHMLAANLVPNVQITQRAMLAAANAAERRAPSALVAETVAAFLAPLEAKIIIDDARVATELSLANSAGLTTKTDISMRDIQRTYSFAAKALKLSGNIAALDDLLAKTQRWGIMLVDGSK
ncbi:hypothetical protein ACHHYP_10207 [Achlya hypogyna]|uniref:Pentacotripeptide-repeat region of PRORP domain-containing protein n=1 Tax=Achlya hypogyna TaxID=1202772 RepID=A0A1V9ZHZ3_ACHHY|nr:hypothetical protein ACHHYP_10207 [Achlya hypogyna]